MRRSLLLLFILLLPTPLLAQNSLRFDLDGDGRSEAVALVGSELSVRKGDRATARLPIEPKEAQSLEMVALAPHLTLVGVTSRIAGGRCYRFYRFYEGQLLVVPVEVAEDDFADSRICTAPATAVRTGDLTGDGVAELIVEERLAAGRNLIRRRVYRYFQGAWSALPLLSGLTVDGVPILPQLAGTYYRAEAFSALQDLQDLQILRTSPALVVTLPAGAGLYQLVLRTPTSQLNLRLGSARRSVDLQDGEQRLALNVSASGRKGRLTYDSAADFTDAPIEVSGLGPELDGTYRPAPYDPRWSSLDAYIGQGVLVGTWNPIGNVGLVLRDNLRVDPGPIAGALVLSSRPAAVYSVDLAATVASPYDFVLTAVGAPPLIVDLRGADTMAVAPARCSREAKQLSCLPTGSPILYHRREAPT
ncbi:hypothetical protein [Gloeobacter kilaueensis]|uniref:FG-GAP repeat-containing protein n=1 Tax=Gloeobacter kilaueensis (strain ATCC BAA-2537 / CCAP 1431/1 / ULC 316 / JS1) TaxID=1183438 RepID=U5QRD1_GLOK1|nr:hypothetical protein [Gloeobacter kilaueensis]AGY60209.1 hypothetical protein GKIL_3963 [Gloeobacter kilaueensis JS1]